MITVQVEGTEDYEVLGKRNMKMIRVQVGRD
jgi:hypothetical protein